MRAAIQQFLSKLLNSWTHYIFHAEIGSFYLIWQDVRSLCGRRLRRRCMESLNIQFGSDLDFQLNVKPVVSGFYVDFYFMSNLIEMFCIQCRF